MILYILLNLSNLYQYIVIHMLLNAYYFNVMKSNLIGVSSAWLPVPRQEIIYN